jgi:predicted amidohydrolase YtcJ
LRIDGTRAHRGAIQGDFRYLLILEDARMTKAGDHADVVFRNARVYTVDPRNPWATSIAIRGERLSYVGDAEGTAGLIGPRTRVVDVGGRLVLPGFIESHWHLCSTTFLRQLALHEVKPTAIAEVVRAYAQAHPEEPAITGLGWIEPMMPDGLVRKETLDAACADRPVLLISGDFHSMWVNSRALEIAGIDADTPEIVGEGTSWYEKDPKTREPTGKIVDHAARAGLWNTLTARGFLPSGVDLYTNSIDHWQHKLAAAGVTTLFDAAFADPGGNQSLLYESLGVLERSNRLLLRVVGSYYHYQGASTRDPVEAISSFREQYHTPLVRAQVLKLFLDGTEIAHTAYLLEPYADRPDTCGHVVISPAELGRIVLAADAAGIDVMIHCVGDAAVRLALDTFEKAILANPARDRRHCITHAFLTHPDDIPRFRKLGIIANTQLQWGIIDPYAKVVRKYYGHERFRQMYKFRTFVDHGVRVALGMDALACSCRLQYRPVEHIESGHTRQPPREPDAPVMPEDCERMQLPDLIAGYTINGAYQLRLEQEVGSLVSGKRADLIVLDKDLFDMDPHAISSIDVLLTMMNGRVTHDAGKLL